MQSDRFEPVMGARRGSEREDSERALAEQPASSRELRVIDGHTLEIIATSPRPGAAPDEFHVYLDGRQLTDEESYADEPPSDEELRELLGAKLCRHANQYVGGDYQFYCSDCGEWLGR